MEHINGRIYLVVLTLSISSFGYELIQEPLQNRTKLFLDLEISGGLRNRQFCDATFRPVHTKQEEFVNSKKEHLASDDIGPLAISNICKILKIVAPRSCSAYCFHVLDHASSSFQLKIKEAT